MTKRNRDPDIFSIARSHIKIGSPGQNEPTDVFKQNTTLDILLSVRRNQWELIVFKDRQFVVKIEMQLEISKNAFGF